MRRACRAEGGGCSADSDVATDPSSAAEFDARQNTDFPNDRPSASDRGTTMRSDHDDRDSRDAGEPSGR